MKTLLLTLLLLTIAISPSVAQSTNASGKSDDQWSFTAAPYLMLPWMDGTTALRGHEIKVNAAPSELFSNLQFGVMGYFEARKSRWGFGVDSIYMALGTTVDQPSANVDFNQGAYTFIALRQLNSNVDFLAGARLNVIQGKFELKSPVQSTVEQTKQWVDPIVGLRVNKRFGARWSFTMEGDIGGFGAGSKFAWELVPTVGLDMGKRTTLKLGYRVLGMDYESGSQDKLFKYDVITQGLVIGAAFHF